MLKVLFNSLGLLAVLLFSDIASAASFPPSLRDSAFFPTENYRFVTKSSSIGKFDNVCSRFDFLNSYSFPDFNFGLPSRKSSFSPLAHAQELKDSLKAVSKLYFMLGSKREQILFLDHVQRISSNARLFIGYHNLVSEGFYKNSFSRNKNFLIGGDFNSRPFDCFFSFQIHKSEFNEFGGINDTASIEGLSKGDLAQLGVFLSADKRINKESEVLYHQRVLLYGPIADSTGVKLNLNSSFNYFVSKSSYTGEGTSAFYDAVLLDSAATADTAGFAGFKASSNLSVGYKGAALFAGADFCSLKTRIMETSSDFFDVVPFVGSSFEKGGLSAFLKVSRVVSDSYRNESSELAFKSKFIFDSAFVNAVNLELASSALPAPYLFYSYSSNHFAWKNAFSEFTKTNSASLSLSVLNSIVISGSYVSLNNRYFLNEVSVPVMSTSTEAVSSASLELFKAFGDFYVSGIATSTSSNSSNLPVPDWQSELRVSWHHSFFKSALKAEFGLSGVYTDSWNAPAYNPSLGNYYLQKEVNVEGYPVLNVFANLHIASATVFLKMERLNYGLGDSAYYLHPGYPVPPRSLKFGVFWNLKN